MKGKEITFRELWRRVSYLDQICKKQRSEFSESVNILLGEEEFKMADEKKPIFVVDVYYNLKTEGYKQRDLKEGEVECYGKIKLDPNFPMNPGDLDKLSSLIQIKFSDILYYKKDKKIDVKQGKSVASLDFNKDHIFYGLIDKRKSGIHSGYKKDFELHKEFVHDFAYSLVKLFYSLRFSIEREIMVIKKLQSDDELKKDLLDKTAYIQSYKKVAEIFSLAGMRILSGKESDYEGLLTDSICLLDELKEVKRTESQYFKKLEFLCGYLSNVLGREENAGGEFFEAGFKSGREGIDKKLVYELFVADASIIREVKLEDRIGPYLLNERSK